jgi:cytochrome c-type biogenesis protein CcmF
MEDLYLVYTGKNPENGRPIIKAHLNPLVWWIWSGAHFILVGTIIALCPNMQAGSKKKERKKRRAPAKDAESETPVEAGGD